MKRALFSILFFLLLLASHVFSQAQKLDEGDLTKLTVGQQIDREMKGDEVHLYSIDLKSNKFTFGVVEQKGIDVVVTITDPNGEEIEEIDAPTGDRGNENILLTTQKDGEYKLKIHPFDPLAPSGKYTLRIERVEDSATTTNGKVDQLFAPWDKNDSPGAAIAVVRNGKIIYKKGYGIANLEYDVPITPSTIFHMASVSKQFTAYAAAVLAQQGKLSLLDDIRQYLPEVPDFDKKITIKQLIHHTSGLRDQWNLLVMAGWRMDDVITKEHVLKLVKHQKELNFEPGAQYLYCNTGYTLLAEIVARVSDKSFPEWCKENIFQPLNMTSTLFYDDHQKIVKNRAYSYSIGEKEPFVKRVLSYANVGATSLFTTAEDLSKWAMNFNDPIVGNMELIRKMENRGILNNGDTLEYAFGQGVGDHKGLKFIGHGGADAGYRTFLGRFPDQKFSVMVLSNLSAFNTSSMAFKIADIYLADLLVEEKPKKEKKTQIDRISVDPAIYEEYAGEYEIESEQRATVSRVGNRLMGRVPGQATIELIPISEARFVIEDESIEVSFQRDLTGKVNQLTIHQNNKDTVAPRVEPFSLKPEQMAEYEGSYYSDELGTSYIITIKKDKLVVQHRRHEDFNLKPQKKDLFGGDVWFFSRLQFERNEENQIMGFKASSGRVKNLRFVRQ